MLLVAALLSLIIWVLGWSSGFLGPTVHVFLLLAILAVLAHVARAISPGAGVKQSQGTAEAAQEAAAECADGADGAGAPAKEGNGEDREDGRAAESVRGGAPE